MKGIHIKYEQEYAIRMPGETNVLMGSLANVLIPILQRFLLKA